MFRRISSLWFAISHGNCNYYISAAPQFDVLEFQFPHAIAVNIALQVIKNEFQMTFVVINGRVD
jgi:hypothetical protein